MNLLVEELGYYVNWEEGKVEVEPKLEGKRMFLIMAPKLKK
jgi:translation initiation factor IF-3